MGQNIRLKLTQVQSGLNLGSLKENGGTVGVASGAELFGNAD